MKMYPHFYNIIHILKSRHDIRRQIFFLVCLQNIYNVDKYILKYLDICGNILKSKMPGIFFLGKKEQNLQLILNFLNKNVIILFNLIRPIKQLKFKTNYLIFNLLDRYFFFSF